MGNVKEFEQVGSIASEYKTSVPLYVSQANISSKVWVSQFF